jgi:hypothetical protein
MNKSLFYFPSKEKSNFLCRGIGMNKSASKRKGYFHRAVANLLVV